MLVLVHHGPRMWQTSGLHRSKFSCWGQPCFVPVSLWKLPWKILLENIFSIARQKNFHSEPPVSTAGSLMKVTMLVLLQWLVLLHPGHCSVCATVLPYMSTSDCDTWLLNTGSTSFHWEAKKLLVDTELEMAETIIIIMYRLAYSITCTALEISIPSAGVMGEMGGGVEVGVVTLTSLSSLRLMKLLSTYLRT